jgi:hypothetical protein
MRGIPTDDSARFAERLWLWWPHHGKVKLQFGWGMGGYAGVLKLSQADELAGKLKPFCDTIRCGGPKEVGRIRIKRVECLN